MKPLVSIVIPFYNEEKVIRAIQSCLKQTYTNIEILVIDDGSEKDIHKLISHINDERLIYKRQSKNSNANVCRNVGIDCAKGKYICFLDSDDIFLKTHVEECIRILKEKGKEGLYGSVVIHNGESPIECEATEHVIFESMIDYLLRKGYGACTSTLFMTRESALDIRWDETLKRHQDYDFVVRYDKKYPFAVKEKPTVIYDADKSNKKNIKLDFGSCITFIERNKTEINTDIYRHYIKHMYLLAKNLNAEQHIMEYYKKELALFPEEEKLMQCLENQDFNFNYQVQIVNA